MKQGVLSVKETAVREGRIFMGRLPKGADLLEALTELCVREGVILGEVRVIGAVTRARVGYYNQTGRSYQAMDWNEHLEILCLAGNVSSKDGAPFVHVHVTLSDRFGGVRGGHLLEGTPVFAAEYVLREFASQDGTLERAFDEETGLFLWA